MTNRIIKWHQILGHINLKDLRKMKSLNLNIPNDYVLNCDICAQAKIVNLPHTSSITNSATRLNQVFHVDLSGKIRIWNRSQYKYYLLIIDEFSRFTYIQLLK